MPWLVSSAHSKGAHKGKGECALQALIGLSRLVHSVVRLCCSRLLGYITHSLISANPNVVTLLLGTGIAIGESQWHS
jgi:hypothetical protein